MTDHHDHDHSHTHAHDGDDKSRRNDLAVFQHGRPPVDRSTIQGWGADLDHKNRPGYPMERMPQRLDAPLTQPQPQARHVEVLVSPERPHMTPLFGSPQPPKGLSGMLRRAAFKTTENDIRHWLLLLLADRVNVVEGIGEDLARGHVPNVFAEMGIKAEWEHNRVGLVKKVAVTAAVAGVAYYLLKGRKER